MPDRELLESTLHDPGARYRHALAFGSPEQFNDPSFRYRRLFSETLGTFMLLRAAAGGGILHARGEITLSAAVVAPALTVTAIILFMGAVSGAHLNPVVSVAFALRGDFAWRRVPGYIAAQALGATLPGPHYHEWQALLMEVALTGGLVSVVLGTASAAQNVGAIGALGVGAYIALAGLWAAPVSGTSMNPARSLGPARVSGHWAGDWVYVVGPLAGALIAVVAAFVLRGPGGDETAREAASGRLGL